VENVHFRNVRVGQVSDAIVQVDFYYEEGPGGLFAPAVRDLAIQDVTCRRSKYALNLRGYPEAPIRDVLISHCVFENVAEANVIQNTQGLSLDDVLLNGRPLRL
jgi:hypothetical protein